MFYVQVESSLPSYFPYEAFFYLQIVLLQLHWYPQKCIEERKGALEFKVYCPSLCILSKLCTSPRYKMDVITEVFLVFHDTSLDSNSIQNPQSSLPRNPQCSINYPLVRSSALLKLHLICLSFLGR
jgi:hypothetical protein